jgi:hypothetical protein
MERIALRSFKDKTLISPSEGSMAFEPRLSLGLQFQWHRQPCHTHHQRVLEVANESTEPPFVRGSIVVSESNNFALCFPKCPIARRADTGAILADIPNVAVAFNNMKRGVGRGAVIDHHDLLTIIGKPYECVKTAAQIFWPVTRANCDSDFR